MRNFGFVMQTKVCMGILLIGLRPIFATQTAKVPSLLKLLRLCRQQTAKRTYTIKRFSGVVNENAKAFCFGDFVLPSTPTAILLRKTTKLPL